MKTEKWILDGEEIEIPLVSDSEIERNNIDDLENTMEIDESEFMEESETEN